MPFDQSMDVDDMPECKDLAAKDVGAIEAEMVEIHCTAACNGVVLPQIPKIKGILHGHTSKIVATVYKGFKTRYERLKEDHDHL